MATAQSSAELAAKTQRLAPLDGIRTVAIGLVFLTHTGARAFQGGWLGVDVFFVISGFLITEILLREHTRSGAIDFRRFYLRRCLRLLPALVLLLVVLTPLNLWLVHASLIPSIASLFYFADFWNVSHDMGLLGQTWSLAVEEQFYLLWPIALLVGLRHRSARFPLAAGTVVLVVVITKISLSHVGTSGVYYLPTTSIPSLAVGAAVAIWLHIRPMPGRLRRCFAPNAVPVLAFAILGILTYEVSRYGSPLIFEGPLLAVSLLPAAVIVHTLAAPASATSRALSARPLVWLGRRSYGFYLWHASIAYYLFLHHWSPAAIAAVTLPVALVVTTVSWQLVELPCNALKDRTFGSSRLSSELAGRRATPRASEKMVSPSSTWRHRSPTRR